LRTLILDIDDTLADTRKRSSFADAGQWDEFYNRAWSDVPVVGSWAGVRDLTSTPTRVIYCTSRPRIYEAPTLEWLRGHYFPMPAPGDLLMRRQGDRRGSPAVKVDLIREANIDLHPDATCIFVDDDDGNIRAVARAFPLVETLKAPECWRRYV